ncbi:MAG: GNAT family N-acetyltransferase [Pseudomonadota bacterium]
MNPFDQAISRTSEKKRLFPSLSDPYRGENAWSPIVSASSSLGTSLWEMEALPARAIRELENCIHALAERSLDPNLFFEPTFLQGALNRITGKPPMLLCLWETIGETRELRLFFPVSIIKLGVWRQPVLRVWSSEFSPLGTPLLDTDHHEEALDRFIHLASSAEIGLPGLMMLPHFPKETDSFNAWTQALTVATKPQAETGSFERAALLAMPDKSQSWINTAVGRKRRKEYARLRRKLEQQGELAFTSSARPDDVRNLMESFLNLEIKSWKGRRGSALYSNKKITAFARQIVSDLANEKKCEIHAMSLDGRCIAVLISIGSQDRPLTWKTVYDEAFAQYSPGVQLMIHASTTMQERNSFVIADSLAAPHHSMIDHLWRDRMAITNLLTALDGDPRGRFKSLCNWIARWDRAKSFVRQKLH